MGTILETIDVMVDPVTVGFVLKSGTSVLQLARSAGLIKTAADRMLEGIAEDVRGLVVAPFHEALLRLEIAAEITDPRRQTELVTEARSKLHDVAARPRAPKNVVALACLYSSGLARALGEDAEARVWARRSLESFGDWLTETHGQAIKALEVTQGKDRKSKRSVGRQVLLSARPLSSTVAELGQHALLVRKLPARALVADVNREAAAAADYARLIGVETVGRPVGLDLTWRWKLLVDAELVTVVPGHSGTI